ncbi:hypothetical protein [Jejuia spongiicola]|uniref:Uncharacterized protein n=1 Tax=Jejuia spongiicola TaxID=2942207 RepID=A0ABT0QAE0_9FLAO|nr:hypothetical protein [Jejuia spongiicola]MCL6293893.1 hypothetical protein [Jejuia spongiicola]
MWETTYQNYVKTFDLKLPKIAMAQVTEDEFQGGEIKIIVFAFNAISVLLKTTTDNYDYLDRTKEFINNYQEYFSWLKEIKQKKQDL